MKIETTHLIGPALDWAVAKACGFRLRSQVRGPQTGAFHAVGDAYGYIWSDTDPGEGLGFYGWSPSRKWNDGGPLITRYAISTMEHLPAMPDRIWEARPSITARGAGWKHYGYGPTPLVATMRCIVQNKLGEFADVPDELVSVGL